MLQNKSDFFLIWIILLHFNCLYKSAHAFYTFEDIPTLPPPCSSCIYCYGRLLDTIQMAKIHRDSKTFVDMKLRQPSDITLKIFDDFMKEHSNKPGRLQVKEFVQKNFEPEGQEFEDWTPEDWNPAPRFFNQIDDQDLRHWVEELNSVWKKLGRKMKAEVKVKNDLYSIIWVPNPVIVPGGRFREFYYWDSYWIIRGLLLSEMTSTVRGMLENFLYIVEQYGHIPNGGRVYYLARSQPPLLIPMVKIFLDVTQDKPFLSQNLPTMEKEFNYWMTNHTIQVKIYNKNYTLAIYGDKSRGPRPESYSEDVESASIFHDNLKKEHYYSELKAAAESGWDFSSRWFITNATNRGNLTSLKTRYIVPVDLNAFIYWNAVILSDFHKLLGNENKSLHYIKIANQWLDAVNAVLWHEESGVWLDYDLLNGVKRDYFSPSNISPLWTGCYNQSDSANVVRQVLNYLHAKNIMNYPGGVPTSLEHTGEQWDFPNAWPPLQHIMIAGLGSTENDDAQKLAFEMAENWLKSNYKAYMETKIMYEKYDATVAGGHGSGGEYEVQEGFGWSNGIIMDLLNKYGRVIKINADNHTPQDKTPFVKKASSSPNSYHLVPTATALIASITAGFIGILL